MTPISGILVDIFVDSDDGVLQAAPLVDVVCRDLCFECVHYVLVHCIIEFISFVSAEVARGRAAWALRSAACGVVFVGIVGPYDFVVAGVDAFEYVDRGDPVCYVGIDKYHINLVPLRVRRQAAARAMHRARVTQLVEFVIAGLPLAVVGVESFGCFGVQVADYPYVSITGGLINKLIPGLVYVGRGALRHINSEDVDRRGVGVRAHNFELGPYDGI